MQKLSIAALGALVALAACADTDPVGLSPDLALYSAHTWQAGNGSAWHGYTAPDVVYDGETGLLCATWDDDYLFTRDDGAYADADHFSFDFHVQDGEDWIDLGDVNAKDSPGAHTACYDLSGWEDGAYLFRVKGMAKDGTGQGTTTHHSEAWIGEVVIGATWSVELVGGSAQNLEHNANANNFTLVYHLFHGTTLVKDCDVVPGIGWAAGVHQHNCDPDTGDRTLILNNPDKGNGGAWDLDFHWDDPDDPFAGVVISTSSPGPSSAAAGMRGGR